MRIITLVLFLSILSTANSRKRREICDKEDTFFKHRHVYTYAYTTTTSTTFVGATASQSGHKLSCTVTIQVPRKCKFIMKLSGCELKERQDGPEDIYNVVPDAAEFLEQLHQYPVLFQMNKGMVVDDSIHTNNEETLQVLNIKRGILSTLQFQILDTEAYTDPITQTDIFGECPTEYSFTTDSGYQGHTYRNLRECNIRQLFWKQFNTLSSTIRPMTGGYTEGPISEGIYPFISEVSCDYKMNSKRTLYGVECLQQQIFKPLAYKGDVLASAMGNVSQSLELIKDAKDRLKGVSVNVKGLDVVDIRFDFGTDYQPKAATEQAVTAALDKLVQKHTDNELDDVPGLFGEMVSILRHAQQDVLELVMADVFSCYGGCEDNTKPNYQRHYVDGLHSCGTEACLLSIVKCMEQGYMSASQQVEFYQGITNLEHVPAQVLEKLQIYCEASEKTNCWLSLGALLSKTKDTEEADSPEEVLATAVLDDIQKVLEDNCDADTLVSSPRHINTMIKTLDNMGARITSRYSSDNLVSLEEQLQKCLTNSIIPKAIKRTILQVLEDHADVAGYEGQFMALTETLFKILEDIKTDMVLRTRAFSLLTKTKDTDTMRRLVTVLKSPQTNQMKSFMYTTIKMLLENDEPGLREVKAAWKAYRSENYFNLRLYDFDEYKFGYSKSISFADFYKFPLSEYLGEQLYMEMVFDPASRIFSALHARFSVFYGDEKYQLFDMDLVLHGFDSLFEIMSSQSDVSFQQLYAMYKSVQASIQQGGPKLTANFQKDIVNSVLRMLEAVNHPKFTDFDLELDVKMSGKHVMFVSLQEMMGYLRQAKQQMSKHLPDASIPQLVNVFLNKMAVDSFKTVEFASLVKVLPTCAGFPLNMTVWAIGLNKVTNTYSLVPGSENTLLAAQTEASVIFKNELKGEMIIPVSLHHQTGMRMKIYAGSEREMRLYVSASEMTDPYGYSLQVKLFPMLENTQSEDVLYAKGMMFLMHNSDTMEIPPNDEVQTEFTSCMSPRVQMLLGRSLCAHAQYPGVTTSRKHAYFPLTGPFDVRLTLGKMDGVLSYSWTFDMFKNSLTEANATYYFNILHEAPGEILGRRFFFNATASIQDQTFNLTSGFPELGFEYLAQYMYANRDQVRTLELSEFAWLNKQPVFGYRLKAVGDRTNDANSEVITMNATLPGLSWELQMHFNKTIMPDDGKQAIYMIIGKWFCSQNRPLLYLLHLVPEYAVQNDDVTSLGLKYIHTDTKDENSDEFHLIFYDTILKASFGKNMDTSQRDIGLAYESNGVETVIIGEGTLKDYSSQQQLFYDYNLNMNSDDYNMVLTGNVKGHPADLQLTADIQYTNKLDDNIASRKRRSLDSIYKNFVKLENAVAGEIKKLADKIPTTSQTGDENPKAPSHAHGGQQLSLPNMIPDFPSIWDLQSWNTKVDLKAKLKPVFGRGDDAQQTGQAPEGMELVVTMDVSHPWNGGYKVTDTAFKIGKSQRTNFRHFWFWIDNSVNTTYTALDGTPVTENGNPVVVRSGGHFETFREAGDSFEFLVSQFSPTSNMSYHILFDWEAKGHDESPLFYVHSHNRNAMMPLLNHDYKESFTLEKGHVRHSALFEHIMLNVSVVTDIYFSRSLLIGQGGYVSLMAFGRGGSVEFQNNAGIQPYLKQPQLNMSLEYSSMPEKSFLYTIALKDKRTISMSSSVFPNKKAPSVALWTAEIALLETSIQEVTFSWTPALDEEMAKALPSYHINKALQLKSMVDALGQNLNKPFMDQTLIVSNVTPRQLMLKFLFPNLMTYSTDLSHSMANFISLKDRQAILEKPGPKVLPRFLKFISQMQAAADETDVTAMSRLQQGLHGMLTGVTYGYLFLGGRVAKSQAIQVALQKRELSWAWTNFYVVDNYGDFPEPTEAIKHVMGPIESLVKYYRSYYYRDSRLYSRSSRLAVIFGRHETTRPINIHTFDNKDFEIPAAQTETCTYLLAADVMSRQYAVVMSPQGLIVLTANAAVTVTYDNQIFLDDSKQPSSLSVNELDGGQVIVEKSDDEIKVSTKVGVSVVCYTLEADVCIVEIQGDKRNKTIGLLGTADFEQITDWRMLSGMNADDVSDFLNEYLVSGPDTCIMKASEDTVNKEICNAELKRTCLDQFYHHYSKAYHCGSVFNVASFRKLCERESWRCDSQPKDMCYTYRAFAGLCEKSGIVETPLSLSETCETVQPLVTEKTGSGSLDIVFVISDHESMLKSGNQPWKYMQELVTSKELIDWYSPIRVGALHFAGKDNDLEGQEIWMGENADSYFVDLDEIDWSKLSGLQGEGTADADSFSAIQKAARYPFNPTSHKMIVVLQTKDQGSGDMAEMHDDLLDSLLDREIAVHVVSTYPKVDGRRVIGMNWEAKVITRKDGYAEVKPLPQNDYTKLVQKTGGALWNLGVLKGGRKKKVSRMVEEFFVQRTV